MFIQKYFSVGRVNGKSSEYEAGALFSYKLRYIVGFWLVEMTISTNQKPTIYRNLYENTDSAGPPENNIRPSRAATYGIIRKSRPLLVVCHLSHHETINKNNRKNWRPDR